MIGMDKQMLMAVLALAAKHGIEAVLAYVKTMNKDEITLEDIQALELDIKRPEEYFK